MIFKLIQRTSRNTIELNPFLIVILSLAFCDICRNAYGCFSNLDIQIEFL